MVIEWAQWSKLLCVLFIMLNTMSLETIPSMSKPAKKEKVVCRPSGPHCVVGLRHLFVSNKTSTERWMRCEVWLGPQVTVLADQLQAGVMLRYNKRTVG